MKNTILTLLFALGAIAASAQEKNTEEASNKVLSGQNEIRLNLLNTILGIPEITYERIFKDNSAVGLSVVVGIDNETEYQFGAIPYYRIYFGNSAKKGTGFFIEANAGLMQVEDDDYYTTYVTEGNYYTTTYQDRTRFNFGLGAAAGGKFLTKNGFVGEIYGGVGRFFGDIRSIEAYPRVGITIGKRF